MTCGRRESWKKQYRTIYESLDKNPRIEVKDLSTVLGMNQDTARRRLKESFDLEYIGVPELRNRSYSNLKEYVYFVKCEEPFNSYEYYKKDSTVAGVSFMIGCVDLWLASKQKIDIKEEVILEGFRSDYHVAYARNCSWEEAVRTIIKKLEAFNSHDYTPTRIIQTHWNDSLLWDEQDELLSRAFMYNVRKKIAPVTKEHHIPARRVHRFLEKIPEYCTVFTRYFPKTAPFYTTFLYMVETDYEDFVIDLFSELPTSSIFFKVQDKLLMLIDADKEFMGDISHIEDSRFCIPFFMGEPLLKKVIKDYAQAIIGFPSGMSVL